MLISHVDEIRGSNGDAGGDGWRSLRFGLTGDKLGFTVTETTIDAGVDHILWYKQHLEACYCIEGTGEVVELDNGKTHVIEPGTFYALDKHDRHRFKANTDMRLVCVFSPALSGQETHDKDGSYDAK